MIVDKAFSGLLKIAPALMLSAQPLFSKNETPNILVIMGDDCTFSDLPLYGGVNVKTPNIDKLASQGLTFNSAYLSMSMSAPCRSELNTGKYPIGSGVCWNHAATRTDVKGTGQYMNALGYRAGIAGKVHIKPASVFQFENVKGVTSSAIADESDFAPAGVTEFINRSDKPFFLLTCFTSAHVPWTVGNPEHFDPNKIKLPPHMADTEDTRKDFCRYLAEIEVLDQQVGMLLDVLEKSGKADNTIVLFTSEQGAQMPGAKWTNWDLGVHTGLVVRWPGKVDAGKRTDALVQYCDILPTLVDVAGGDSKKEDFDGTSFLGVLKGKTDKHRDYVYFMHNNLPEGPSFPIRAVSDGTYTYIRNLAPYKLYIEKHVMGTMRWHSYWPSWLYEADVDGRTNMLLNRYMKRPVEELYNVKDDPENFKNLIKDETLNAKKKELSKQLDLWMKQQNDPGKKLDTKKYQEPAFKGVHNF